MSLDVQTKPFKMPKNTGAIQDSYSTFTSGESMVVKWSLGRKLPSSSDGVSIVPWGVSARRTAAPHSPCVEAIGELIFCVGVDMDIMFAVCDGESQSLCDFAEVVLKRAKHIDYDSLEGPIVHIDQVWVPVEERGREYGPDLVCAVLELLRFKYLASVAYMKPFPLQFSGRADDPGFAPAVKIMRNYWKSHLPFASIRGSEWLEWNLD